MGKNETKHYEIKNEQDGTIAQLIALQLLLQAAHGDLAAIREVIDRTEGKPKQNVEVEVPALAGVTVQFTGMVKPPVQSEADIEDIEIEEE